MAKLTDNKTQLQTLVTKLSSKGILPSVTSVNGKTGDVKVERSDLNITTETWTFELEDGTTVDKEMVFYTVPMITFTIDGATYQAEEGMTWGEWVESEYNTDGYYIEDVFINEPNDYKQIQIEHESNGSAAAVKTTDTILPNINYIFSGLDIEW